MSKQKEALVIRSARAGSMEYVRLYDSLADLLIGLPYWEVKHGGKTVYAQLNEINTDSKTNGRVYRKSDNKAYQFCSSAVLPIKFRWNGRFDSDNGSSFPGTVMQIGTISSATQQVVKVWLRYDCRLNEPRSGSTGIRVVIESVVGPSETKKPTAKSMLFSQYASSPAIVSIPKGTFRIFLQGFKPKWAGFTYSDAYVKITNSSGDNAGWPS